MLPISGGHLSPHNSQKTPIARWLERGIGVFREFEISPKFYLRNCVAYNIGLFCSAIYSTVYSTFQSDASSTASPDLDTYLYKHNHSFMKGE